MSARTRYCSRCLTTFVADEERCPNLACRQVRPRGGWGELLEEGEIIDRTYRVLGRLAIGGAGVTYLGVEVDGQGAEVGPRLAIKVLYQQRDQGPYLRRLAIEAQILQGLNHANIVECRGFVHRAGHSPYLVTRFEEGGSLLDHIRRVGTLPVRSAAEIARQVGWALEVAHRQGVIHRDLKPENVLLVKAVGREQTPEVRVADFGIAKIFGGVGDRLTRVGAFVGTPQYAAPEQFDGLAPEPATDIYALGALLYFCLTARPIADFMGELDAESQKVHLLRHLPPKLGIDGLAGHVNRWVEDTLAIAMAADPGDRCDLSTLDRRLADVAAERDPGLVKLPPTKSTITASPTLSSEMYHPTNSTDEVSATPDPGTGPRAVEWAPPPERPPPDPAAGTADPLGDPDRVSTPRRRPTPPPIPAVAAPASAGVAPQPAPPAGMVPPAAGMAQPAPAVPAPANGAGPSAAPAPPKPLGGAPEKVSASWSSQEVLHPAPERAPDRPVKRRSAAGGVGCTLVTLAGLTAGVVAVAIGAWLWLQPRPTVLTGTEKDAAVLADWRGIAGALGRRGEAAQATCARTLQTQLRYLQVQVVVDGAGKVQRADLLNYAYEPARACMQKELQQGAFPRSGAGLVQVAVALQR